ncbi:MAG: class I SAM-dependent methyltransferase [Deltaproteobacteria bacterium]|jgi:caffeoyl-CoA O-methyltransferase|nr:class I SAM-dependent methyltransferase [Deltaproteobacteria bacterium]MBW2530917.1 class I SAM-dependent methyltransferase [Deltaproteobacteria bacterium]
MKLFVPDDIEQYAHDHTSERPALFDELRQRTYADVPSPHMQVGRVEGTLLKLLCSLVGARRVLEIGTFTGYSALCMAEALPADGEIITCDRDETVTPIAQSFFDRSPHGGKIEIRLGDALETVRSLDQRPFDLAFVDADKARYPDYYRAILPRVRPGGLLVFDNVLWSGEVLAPESDDAQGIVALNDLVQADEAVENVLLTIRDGVLIARKI